MAIAFSTFYPRFGKLCEAAAHANTYRGTTLPADVADIAGVYTADIDLIEGLYQQQVAEQNNLSGFNSFLRQMAINTLIDAVDDDRTMIDTSLRAYLTEFNRQQITASIELDDSPATIGTITADGANIGNAKFVISDKNEFGVTRDTVLPETLRFDCVTDEDRGATKWNEVFSVYGVAQVADKLSPTWPGGSGSANTIVLTDPAADGIVTNSSFDAFTGHTPDNWTIVSGTAGTHVEFTALSPRPEQTNCMKWLPGSAIELKQAVTLQPNTKYGVFYNLKNTNNGSAVNASVRLRYVVDKVNTVTTSGSAVVAVTDTVGIVTGARVTGTGIATGATVSSISGLNVTLSANCTASGTVTVSFDAPLKDDQATDNIVTVDVAASTYDGKWDAVTGTFLTPSNIYGTVYLHILTADLTDQTVYIANLQLAEQTTLYNGGPSLVGFSNLIPSTTTDRYTSAITVSSTAGSVVRWMERFYDVTSYGISIRTASSPTSGYDDATLISI